MAEISIPYAHDDYTVGWVCALPKELAAAIYMLEERHADLKQPRHDPNAYTLGKIGEHNVVIAGLPKGVTGNSSSATVAAKMVSTFPNIKIGLMVGIGSGIPQKVRLGDVVISAPVDEWPGVVQWDMGKAEESGFVQTGSLNPPAKGLLTSLSKFEAEQIKFRADMMAYLDKKVPEEYFLSPRPQDVAYESGYRHVGAKDCSQCDENMAMKREPKQSNMLHYGLVASGNQVIKSAAQRDKLYRQFNESVLCIETEAAGLMNDFPCIVIRGICDYADSHANVAWQEYAAAVAAACAKTFLDVVPVSEVDKLQAVKSIIPPRMIEKTMNSWFSYFFPKSQENPPVSADPKETKDTTVSEDQRTPNSKTPVVGNAKPSGSDHDSQQVQLSGSCKDPTSVTQSPPQSHQPQAPWHLDASIEFKSKNQNIASDQTKPSQETEVAEISDAGDCYIDPRTPPPQYDERFDNKNCENWVNQTYAGPYHRLGDKFQTSPPQDSQYRDDPSLMPSSRGRSFGQSGPDWSRDYSENSYNDPQTPPPPTGRGGIDNYRAGDMGYPTPPHQSPGHNSDWDNRSHGDGSAHERRHRFQQNTPFQGPDSHENSYGVARGHGAGLTYGRSHIYPNEYAQRGGYVSKYGLEKRSGKHSPTKVAATVTQRQALGQIAPIGSLYDARKDQILPQSVFSEQLFADAICKDKVPSKECKIERSGSLLAKSRQLGLSPELSLSLLAGTGPYTAKGSAGHLAHKQTDTAVQEVSIVCKEVTRHDTLDLDNEELQDIVDEEVLQAEEATHVITGIWWGTKTAVTSIASMACPNTDDKAKEALLGSQERVVEYIGQLLTGNVTTTYTTFKDISKSLNFRVNADIDPGKQAAQISDFDGVCHFISELPAAIKKARRGNGTCIIYDLVPIEEFAQIMNKEREGEAKAAKPVDPEYQERVLLLFERLYAARVNLNSYLETLSLHELSVPERHIENTQKNISQLNDLEDRLKNELYQDLPRARDSSFKGTLKLNNPEWNADIGEYESLIFQFAAKMAFESEATELGIKYIHPIDTETACSECESYIYILYYSDTTMDAPNWKDQYTKFMELARAKDSGQLILVVDCDFEGGRNLGDPRIELRENGKIVTQDFVVEQQSLVGKCLVRPATPADMDILPSESRDSIRRSVKLCCPCSADKTNECVCRTCKETIFFLADDGYMYCNCGRYKPVNAAFKCLDPAHGNDYLKYEDPDKLVETLHSLKEFEQYNILILGETGVGKSTFINGFMNYMLFETLDEALKTPGLHWAIPSSFKYTETNNKKLETFTVTVGNETKSQRYSLDGQSATRSCVTYVLHMNGLTLRLIDTPGIGDTRGLRQDKENVKDIVKTLKSVDKISTILFLMRPNLSRLGQVFNFCMTELLSHLHKETNQNIVFGFTNARSTNYSLGDTGIPLQKLLKDKNTGITVDYDNTFFFDSESFRYLAAYKIVNKEMKDKPNFDESFRISAEEARRLVNKTIRMVTHEVRKTLSLSDTRIYIEGLKTPMILINKLADEDQAELERHKSHIRNFGMSNSALEDKLKMTVRKPVKTMLPSPRTVCTDDECRTVDGDETGEGYFVYKQICHDNCYIKTTNEQIAAREISTCEAFDYSAKPCRTCGHEWTKHQHISYSLTVEEVKVDNTTILEIYNGNKSESEKAEAAITCLERKRELLGERKKFINRSLATFGAYLSSIAMVKYNDATITYLDYLIDDAKKEGNADSQRQFEEQRRIYKEQFDEITKGNPELDLPPKLPNDAEINEIIRQLDQMEVNGSRIKDLLGEQMDNTPSACNTVTIPLETAGKGTDSFSWIEQPPPRKKRQGKKARSLSRATQEEKKLEQMKDDRF